MNIMHQNPYDDDDLGEIEIISKSELKRQRHAMQDFAMKLIKLTKHQRKQIPLTIELEAAMVVADKIKDKPDALNRHSRFVCKLLLDVDLEPINQALERLANKHQVSSIQHEKYAQLRDQVLGYDNEQIEQLVNDFETLDRQKFRQLIRQASKELKAEKPAKYHQELLQYLKQANVISDN